MSCNVGGIERMSRILAGLALLSISFFHVVSGGFAILAYVVGGVAFITGVIGFCPAWLMFGINTCGARPVQGEDR